MAREMQFFMQIINKYSEYKNSTAGDTLTLWDELEISSLIYENYEAYRNESIENVFADIDKLTVEKQQKLKQ
jgi:hypothetical protein